MAKIKDQYIEMLKPSFAHGKPVVITEFGYRTYKGADSSTEGMAGDLIDYRLNLSVIMKYIVNAALSSVFGVQVAPPRMRLKKGEWMRDEESQARELADQLRVLDGADVEGAAWSRHEAAAYARASRLPRAAVRAGEAGSEADSAGAR